MSKAVKVSLKSPGQLKSTDIPKLRKWILNTKQDGKCAICKCVPDRPCLDHHHIKKVKGTGLIRGVLCNKCNVFIAKSENNCVRYGIAQADLPTILRNIAEYLERNHYPYIHPSEKPKETKLTKSSYNKLQKLYRLSPIKSQFPEYPKSGKLIKKLNELYTHYNLIPEFYSK